MIAWLSRKRWLAEASRALEERDGERADAALAKVAASTELDAAQWYDWGLAAKFRCDWRACADRNLRALELGLGDEDVLWNLGIAAEILRDEALVLRAWERLGLARSGTAEGMPMFECGTGPVRLSVSPEVVWCQRLSPARACILNVPLPDTERRFGDIVVHDGEPRGERVVDGKVFSVLDELALVCASRMGTFVAEVIAPDAADITALQALTDGDRDLQIEDWTASITLRCAACDANRVDYQTACTHRAAQPRNPERRLGIAATRLSIAEEMLDRWARSGAGRSVITLEVRLEPGRAN